MRDTSLLDEINAGRHGRKARIKYYVAGSIMLALVVGAGTSALITKQDEGEIKSPTTTTQVQATSTAPPTTPLPAPAPQPVTPVITPPTSPSIDENALNAKLCQSIIDNAKALNESHNSLYFDSWNSWTQTFYGNYDSAEALESKQFYKDHTKKLFNELVSSTNPSMQNSCKSTTSLADILIQPNYDQW